MSEIALFSSLQSFLNQRAVDVEKLTVTQMVALMVDWFRLAAIDGVPLGSPGDSMLFRYGGWSEGCVTGFKFGLLRRVASQDASNTDWFAGITLMFEPSRYASVAPLSTTSADWQSLDAFVRAIESSPGYRLSMDLTPMAVMVESQGFR